MVGDDLQNSVEIRVHVSSVVKWVTGLGEHGLFEFFSRNALISTLQRMPESCCTVSCTSSIYYVSLMLSYLALPDATAPLVMGH